jgi:hypothetical protein
MFLVGDIMDFADWLQKELDKRDWSQAKLAKNAGIKWN